MNENEQTKALIRRFLEEATGSMKQAKRHELVAAQARDYNQAQLSRQVGKIIRATTLQLRNACGSSLQTCKLQTMIEDTVMEWDEL